MLYSVVSNLEVSVYRALEEPVRRTKDFMLRALLDVGWTLSKCGWVVSPGLASGLWLRACSLISFIPRSLWWARR